MNESVKVTAAHIRAALTLRYPKGSHALLFEVANGTGANTRRFADAVAFGMWPSHGHEIEGIEIKVSRSDFLHELKQPEKSQEVYQYCHRWWLAVPKGMVEIGEVPASWGLLELVGDSLRVKKKAPALTPINPSIGFVAAMLRRGVGADEEMSSHMIQREVRRQVGDIAERERRIAEQNVSYRVKQAEEAMRKLDEINARTGVDLRHYTPTEDWVEAIKYLRSTDNKRLFEADKVERIRQDALRLAESLGQLPSLKEAA